MAEEVKAVVITIEEVAVVVREAGEVAEVAALPAWLGPSSLKELQ